MRLLIGLPYDYEKYGGLKILINNYSKGLSALGVDVQLLLLPYHAVSRKALSKYQEELDDWIAMGREDHGSDIIMGFTLNQVYILQKYMDLHGLKTFAFMMDSLTLRNESMLNVQKEKRLPIWIKYWVYRYKESYCIRMYDRLLYVSLADIDYINRRFMRQIKNKHIYFLTNGVNIPYDYHNNRITNGGQLTLGILSDGEDINLYPLLNDIFPMIQQKNPNTRLVIGGKVMPKQLSLISSMNAVEYIGFVEKIEDFYNQIDVVVTTVAKQCGVINRILEAWAYEKAVIGYKHNFYTFKDAIEGSEYVSCTKAAEFAEVIYQFEAGNIDYKQLGINGRRLVDNRYRWDDRCRELKQILFEDC